MNENQSIQEETNHTLIEELMARQAQLNAWASIGQIVVGIVAVIYYFRMMTKN